MSPSIDYFCLFLPDTCKMRNEIETKRNEINRNETKFTETKRNKSKRN